MLSKIKAYLMQQGEELVSLTDLANRFGIDPDRMRFMLSHWVRKGCVAHYQNKCHLSGGNCNGCSFAEADYFCWKKQQTMKIPMISLNPATAEN